MNKKFGFNNRILRIDLNSKKISINKVKDYLVNRYLGGPCNGIDYLLRNLEYGIDPLSKKNILIFSTSILTGIDCSGCSIYSVLSKSPITGYIGETFSAGFWGVELKKTGFDMIIVEGGLKKPGYLYINNENVEIRNAEKIWGKECAESYNFLIDEIGDDKTKIALIGPAGENLVRFASIINDNLFSSPRLGMGAVMGSKKLKAICVRGSNKINTYNEREIKRLSLKFKNHFLENPVNRSHFDPGGASSFLDWVSKGGFLSSKNYRTSFFKDSEKIDGKKIAKKYDYVNVNCSNCYGGCKGRLKNVSSLGINESYCSPEFETLASIPYNCQVGDISYALKLCETTYKYGLDGISLGAVLSFAIECYKNKLIDLKDTEGVKLEWGNGSSLLRIIEKIVFRKGIGGILAEGVKIASEKIKGSKPFAVHVKGLEIPMHDPRFKQMVGLGYAVYPIGPNESCVEHDNDFDFDAPKLYMDKVKPLSIYERIDSASLSDEKVRMFYYLQIAFSMLDALGACKFAFSPVRFFSYQDLVDMVSAVTGSESSLFELMKLGERRLAMLGIFRDRESKKQDDNKLPDIFFKEIEDGPLKGLKMDEKIFKKARKLFYRLAGYDEKNGRPRYYKLVELGIQDLAKGKNQ